MGSLSDHRCKECGAPATNAVRDMQETTDPLKDTWMTWKPHGEIRYGCDKHRQHAQRYSRDGKLAGDLTDDEGRPIPQ